LNLHTTIRDGNPTFANDLILVSVKLNNGRLKVHSGGWGGNTPGCFLHAEGLLLLGLLGILRKPRLSIRGWHLRGCPTGDGEHQSTDHNGRQHYALNRNYLH
jgi:hypothetical protein